MGKEDVENQEVNDSPTMEETALQTLRAINARNAEAPQADEPVAPPEETGSNVPPSASDRTRDDKGRFAKSGQSPPDEGENTEALPVEVTPAPAKPAFIPKWKKEALEKWALLDPAIKTEVERREQDFHKGIEGYKDKAQKFDEFASVIQPYQASMPMPAHQFVGQLLGVEQMLRFGNPQQKQAMLMKLAQDYGVQLNQAAESQPQAQVAPEVAGLYQRLSQLEGNYYQTLQQQQQAKESELMTRIQKFSADPARAEYFETLMPHMTALLQSGLADSLESAYEQAYQQHPVTKPLFLAKQQEEWRKQATQKAAEAKKAAAVNVKQKGTFGGGVAQGSMQDTIRAKARELGLTS